MSGDQGDGTAGAGGRCASPRVYLLSGQVGSSRRQWRPLTGSRRLQELALSAPARRFAFNLSTCPALYFMLSLLCDAAANITMHISFMWREP